MPVSSARPPPLDLRRLAATDPAAAELGWVLNAPAYGGVSRDGDPFRLTYDEFLQGQQRFGSVLGHPDDLQALARLQRAFLEGSAAPGGAPASVGAGTPARALVGADALRRIGPGGGVDMTSALFTAPDGRTTLVYETGDMDFTQGGLRVTEAAAGEAFGPGAPLVGVKGRIQAAPSAVKLAGRDYLYWAEADGLQSTPRLYRREWTPEGFGAPEPVAAPPGLRTLMGWPRLLAVPGGVVAAYRDDGSVPRLAFSRDGKRFFTSEVRGPPGAMAAVGHFRGGGLAYTYQTQGQGAAMTSWVSVSSPDGTRWAPPVPVTTASPNVHDTSFVSRADGGLDLYYIYPPGDGAGFSLFRRALREDGTLGPEQRLTGPDGGEPSKPQANRLPDGRLLVTFADITRRDAQGQPSEQRLTSVVLDGDAP